MIAPITVHCLFVAKLYHSERYMKVNSNYLAFLYFSFFQTLDFKYLDSTLICIFQSLYIIFFPGSVLPGWANDGLCSFSGRIYNSSTPFRLVYLSLCFELFAKMAKLQYLSRIA